MKAVIAFLTSLLVLCAQGQSDNTSNKCKCYKNYITRRINTKLIMGEPLIHSPSNFCPHTEIIIKITTDNKEKCVNPQSPLGKLILKNRDKHEKKGAVSTTTASTTTASSQTSTWSSSTQKIRAVSLH